MELWFNIKKTMVLWKKNYGATDKTMVLGYTENYGTSIYEWKKHGRWPKNVKLWFTMEKTIVIYQNNWSF